MDHSIGAAPRTFLLKLKIHCKTCEKALKGHLRRVQGVHSVEFDEKKGTVTISGTVKPSTIMSVLEHLGRKAELVWQQIPAPAAGNSEKNELQVVTKPKLRVDRIMEDPEMIEQLLKLLSRAKMLKNVEITVKLNVHDHVKSRNKNIVEITTDNEGSTSAPKISRFGGGAGGGCGGSTSCHGGRLAHHNHHHDCCCCSTHNGCVRGWPNHYPNWGNPYWGCPPPQWGYDIRFHPRQPPWPPIYAPTAPPYPWAEDYYSQLPPLPQPRPPPPSSPPPAQGYPASYISPFSDYNTEGCNIM